MKYILNELQKWNVFLLYKMQIYKKNIIYLSYCFIENEKVSETKSITTSFNFIKEEINQLAEKHVIKILKEAQTKKEEILKNVKAEVEKIEREIINEAELIAEQERLRVISRKKLFVKMNFLKYREKTIDAILEEAYYKLKQRTSKEAYNTFIKKLVHESSVAIGGGNLVIAVNDTDRKVFQLKLLEEIASQITDVTGVTTKLTLAKFSSSIIGGVVVSRSDQKLYVDNSFETRFARAKDKIRVKVLEELGG